MLRALRMGAKVSPNMSTTVTHLVVGEVNSKKYIVASENKITTVTPKWIDDVWNKSGSLKKDFFDFIIPTELLRLLSI